MGGRVCLPIGTTGMTVPNITLFSKNPYLLVFPNRQLLPCLPAAALLLLSIWVCWVEAAFTLSFIDP